MRQRGGEWKLGNADLKKPDGFQSQRQAEAGRFGSLHRMCAPRKRGSLRRLLDGWEEKRRKSEQISWRRALKSFFGAAVRLCLPPFCLSAFALGPREWFLCLELFLSASPSHCGNDRPINSPAGGKRPCARRRSPSIPALRGGTPVRRGDSGRRSGNPSAASLTRTVRP